MPTYIVLQEYTEEGIEDVGDPDRLAEAKALAESMACEVTAFYLTFGQYDSVVVVEAPDDRTFARLALSVGKTGTVTTETLKAFPEDEVGEIFAGLPEDPDLG